MWASDQPHAVLAALIISFCKAELISLPGSGMAEDQGYSRSDAAGEQCSEGMELEREDSRFHEWAAIDRNGSVINLGR